MNVKGYILSFIVGIIIATAVILILTSRSESEYKSIISELRNRLSIAERDVEEATSRINAITAELKKELDRNYRLTNQLTDIQGTVRSLREEIDRYKGRIGTIIGITQDGITRIESIEGLNGDIEATVDRIWETIRLLRKICEELRIGS